MTDRRRLSEAYGSGEIDRVVRQVEAAARAGVDFVQVRERDLDAGPLSALVSRSLEAVEGTATKVIVNERLDVALACGVHGVHLRADSPPAARIRPIVPPGFLIGRSVHGVGEAVREAGHLDYVLLGPIFPTSSKDASSCWLGPAALGEAARQVAVPILAIGGVNLARAPSVARSGAVGFAAIGLFADAPGPDALAQIVRDARKIFDMPPAAP